MGHGEFLTRYHLLVKHRELQGATDDADACKRLVACLPAVDSSHCQVGATRVFMKNGVCVWLRFDFVVKAPPLMRTVRFNRGFCIPGGVVAPSDERVRRQYSSVCARLSGTEAIRDDSCRHHQDAGNKCDSCVLVLRVHRLCGHPQSVARVVLAKAAANRRRATRAAVKIQSIIRMFRCLLSFRQDRLDVVRAQACVRGLLARKLLVSLRHHRAASKFQALYRMWLCWGKYQDIVNSALTVQHAVSGSTRVCEANKGTILRCVSFLISGPCCFEFDWRERQSPEGRRQPLFVCSRLVA
jgi:hypothetical protein